MKALQAYFSVPLLFASLLDLARHVFPSDKAAMFELLAILCVRVPIANETLARAFSITEPTRIFS